jgi:hypothetical protein
MKGLMRSAMCDLYPPAEGLPGLSDCDVDAYLAELERDASVLVWIGLVASTWAYVASPLLTVYVPLPSFALPRALRDRHANALASTRLYHLRQAAFLLKMFAGLCWGRDPGVRRALALDPYGADPGSARTA